MDNINWELTQYERARRPQEITIDADTAATTLTYPCREIICPLCKNVLHKTMAAKECLHRFCGNCITNALNNSNKKECPVCRHKLTTKQIREDPNFDTLIEKFYNKDLSNQQLNHNKFIVPDSEVILKPLLTRSDDNVNPTSRFLKCPSTTTMSHISRYLSMRPDGIKEIKDNCIDDYKLCILRDGSQGEYAQLTGSDILQDVKKKHQSDTNRPLEIYYFMPVKNHHNTSTN